MADQPVTREKLIDADIDVENLGKAVNELGIVNPRYGDAYPTLPSAIQIVLESGGFEPFSTEMLLKASVPILTKKAAYALDTHKIFLWENNVWVDTGLSAIDQAKGYALELNKTFIGEKSDLKALFLFEDVDGKVVAVIKKDGNIITPYADLNQIQDDVDFVNMFSDSIEQSNNRVSADVSNDNSLYDFEDNNGQKVASITRQGDIKINNGNTVLSATTVYAGEQTSTLCQKEYATADYLNLNLQRLLLNNTSTLSPFVGSHKQQFSIKTPSDFLALKITQGDKIEIDTPYYAKTGNNFSSQVVHPYVCSFSKTVSGFKHIMAITPFHSTNDMYENPCIYGSNNLREFELLKQFDQPLMTVLPTGNYNYNSDPSCAFDHTTGEFCVISRNTQVIDGANISKLFLLRTKDFVLWSEPVEMQMNDDMLSPTVVFDTTLNKWVMFGNKNAYNFGRKTADSLDGFWEDSADITTPFTIWHQEVKYCGGHYVAIFGDNEVSSSGALYLGISTDGITWQFSSDIFTGAHLPAYKPSISHEFVDSNHIVFNIVWTSSDKTPLLADKWRLFSAKTNPVEVI